MSSIFPQMKHKQVRRLAEVTQSCRTQGWSKTHKGSRRNSPINSSTNDYQHLLPSSSHKNYLENDGFLKEQKSWSCYCVAVTLLHSHKQLCLRYHSKHLQSAGNIREETEKAIKFEAFAKHDEQRGWQDAPGVLQCSLLGCLSTLKKLYWLVIIKTLSLIFSPGSRKFVPQLFSQPHDLQTESTNLTMLSNFQSNIFSVLSAWVAYVIHVWNYGLQTG